jgi:peptidoglycan/LPS O-acetylase OafA/YrhL
VRIIAPAAALASAPVGRHRREAAAAPRPERSRYFDLLRAIAIVRVVLYHATAFSFITVFFPSMGVMFAMAGSLMATSLDRYGVRAVGRRLRRLLPPFWLVAAIFVPAMLLTGLVVNWRMLLWILPLQDPPLNGWGQSALRVIWYIREYLWFVIISPIALPLFRRWPLPVLLVPVVVRVLLVFTDLADGVFQSFGTYFGCWLLGFAHQQGLLRQAKRWMLVTAAIGLGLLGAASWVVRAAADDFDLNDHPLVDALWSMGFVLILIGFAPATTAWLRRLPFADRLVTLLNSRAVTIYLWHAPALVGFDMLLTYEGWHPGQPYGLVLRLAAVSALVALAIMAFGWVEDLAARRKVILLPWRTAPAEG